MEINYSEELRTAEEHLKECKHRLCIQHCGTLMERMLLERARWLRGLSISTELNDRIHEIEADIGKGKDTISMFGLMQLQVFYVRAGLFDELRKRLKSSIRRAEDINWDRAVEWRNCAAHARPAHGQDELGHYESSQMLLWTRMLAEDLECLGTTDHIQEEDAAALTSCPRCGGDLMSTWKYCPFCGRAARAYCRECGQKVESEWRVCPFCESRIEPMSDDEDARIRREYLLLCRGVWADNVLNREERSFLERRRLELGLSFRSAREIEAREAPEGLMEYETIVEALLSDGGISSHERAFLEEKAKRLGIPENLARSIEQDMITRRTG